MNNINYEIYEGELTVITPIHIGDGSKISKKEYLIEDSIIYIFDFEKLYNAFYVQGREAEDEFTDFLLKTNPTKSLKDLLEEYRVIYQNCASYKIQNSGFEENNFNIMTYIKDAYGNPYVPGSSIKGFIKTAIISYSIYKNDDVLSKIKNKINDALYKKYCFKELDKYITKEVENVLRLQDLNPFSGLIISDSEPINKNSLCIAGKYDKSCKNKEKEINIYKESLSPNVNVKFILTLDKSKIKIDINFIKEALVFYNSQINKYFLNEFGVENSNDNFIFVGGGSGFPTKTIIYQIYGEEAKKITWKIFKKNFPINMFKKHKDMEGKVTPHMRKCTKFKDKDGRIKTDDIGKALISFNRKQ